MAAAAGLLVMGKPLSGSKVFGSKRASLPIVDAETDLKVLLPLFKGGLLWEWGVVSRML
jgi:hypothetical protein